MIRLRLPALLAVLAVALGPAVPAPAFAPRGGTLTLLHTGAELVLDPARVTSAPVTQAALVLRRLTGWDAPPGEPPKLAPDLATDTGQTTDGGLTWTYTLKPGLRYEDGTPITSADIKYGIERTFAPEVTLSLAYHKTLLTGGDTYRGPATGAGLDSIETPDARRVVFHLRTAYPDWPWVTSTSAFTPVPRGNDDPRTYAARPVASGPYRVGASEPGKRVVLERNPYWDRTTDPLRDAGPDRIVLEMGLTEAAQFDRVAADTGTARDTIALGMIPADRAARARQEPAVRRRLVHSEPSFLSYLALNNRRGALRELKVRQAMQYAMDKAAYRRLLDGVNTLEPATTLIPPGMAGRVGYDLYPAGPSGDVATAKRLLAEAGHPALRLTMRVEDRPIALARARIVRRALARAGITVEFRKIRSEAWLPTIRSGDTDFDLQIWGWTPDFPSPASSLQPLFGSREVPGGAGGGMNITGYADPEVDAAMERALAEPDQRRALAQWAALDQRIMRDAPVVPLLFQGVTVLHGSNVRGLSLTSSPNYVNFLRVSLKRD
ncbi:ABC transporter substrate-binding protein [Actinoplanes sp. NEAU-A12]|uniref:ABC transporter substrate-binding protein n=1 Tax=Actinoplanes sandaracinus TaxID=3045177 RepID=A0ABT6WIJ9_9ACTN|nr:ABC transporter substrate-binding protein [Actinoplanes sandaracinus]MDI6099561.1 ABC transporter substrate-binding protein [Actinoplanes sandaracinus]